MSAPTDYKQMYKRAKAQNVVMSNRLNALLNEIDPAVKWLKTIVTEEQFTEFINKLGITLEVPDAKRDD